MPSAKRPSPPEPTLLSLVHLSAYWFGLSYLWNGLGIILLPALLVGLVPAALKGTYLGALSFVGLAVTMLTQPVAGAVSDRSGWLGRWGKRRPWMVLGTAGDLAFLAGLALATDFWVAAVAYVGLQVASGVAEAAFQSLLPDRVPGERRGRGSGIKNALQIVGFIAGVGVGGWLTARGRLDLAFAATGAALVITLVWTVLGVREEPFLRPQRRSLAVGEALRRAFVHSFAFDRRRAPGYARLLAGRGLVLAAFYALQGFAQYFIADVLAVPNPVGTTATLMVVMAVAVFLLAVPAGALADRLGRRPLSLFAVGLGAVAITMLVFVASVSQLVVAGGLVGVAVGVFVSANWAWAADLVPSEDAGRYLALGNIAVAASSALARLLAGLIVDGGNAVRMGLGYQVLFAVLALAMAAGALALAGVPETRPAGRLLVARPPTSPGAGE